MGNLHDAYFHKVRGLTSLNGSAFWMEDTNLGGLADYGLGLFGVVTWPARSSIGSDSRGEVPAC